MTSKLNYKSSDLEDLRIRFEFDQRLSDSGDPHDFITEITGTLNAYNEDTDAFDIPAGHISVHKVAVGRALIADASLFDIFVCRNSELHELYGHLFDDKNDFHQRLEDVVHPGLGSDLLIIERVEIDPKYRGQDLGLRLVSRATDTFADGCQYVVTIPSPLQFGLYSEASAKDLKIKGFNEFAKDEKVATKKLADHWKKIGFVELPDEPSILITSPALR